jgi:SAM-dependent methyltransferase
MREFPVRFGIPDFRLEPDPYISIDREITKTLALTAGGALSFRELLTAYYRLSPENPPELHRHYVAAMEAAVGRGAALLRKLERRFPTLNCDSLLDVGCGTAGMTAAAARRCEQVVGVDVALRWLVIGRQRLVEEQIDAPLICANAEWLPFKPESFSAVVADAALEHVRDSVRMRDEIDRVLKVPGAFFLTTNNRYSILPEPHVHLWGFGLLPRRWMESVAWRVRKTPYKTRLHSRAELKHLFKGHGELLLPYFEEKELGARGERLRKWWDRIRQVGLLRFLLRGVVPQYFIAGRKGGSDGAGKGGSPP